jgi:ribosomal protein S18 acetylase RimI-like enzyme
MQTAVYYNITMQNIRDVKLKDFHQISLISHQCFLPQERTPSWKLKKRIQNSSVFQVLEDENQIRSYICAIKVMESDIQAKCQRTKDEENGDSLLILSLATRKEFQSMGYASKLLENIEKQVKNGQMKNIILLSREDRISFYQQHGFNNEGSPIKEWYLMKKTI